MNPQPAFTPRQVDCPACGGPSRYAAGNPYRPFCSALCKGIDLGAWASEQFTLPADAPPEALESGARLSSDF